MAFMSREYKFNTTNTMQKKDQHTMALRSLKKLIKPLLRLVKKKQLVKKTLAEIQNTYNSSLEDMRKDPVSINAVADNAANEALEQRLCNEILQENTYNSSLEDMRKDPISINAVADNAANEVLEQRLYNEISQCPENAAVIVYQGQQEHVVAVNQQQQFIPVHFARTNSGTFFWTSMDLHKQQELQMRNQLDRWAQA